MDWTDESGAVTVDWVVMTGALVGLGLAVSAVVSGGVQTASEATASQLRGELITSSFVQRVTQGFTATGVYEVGATITDLAWAKAYSFSMDVTLDASDTGILYEAGGTTHGTVLYQHDGKLYLQSGRSNDTGPASNRGEAVWDVSDGTYTIEGSLDHDTGLALYVNGQLVSQDDFSHSYLSGPNDGVIGDANGSVAVNRGGYQRGDGHPGAGELTVYMDQLTGGENGTS